LEKIKSNPWKVYPDDLEFWYGKVGEPQTYEHNQATKYIIEEIKKIEQETYRESQAFLNNNNVENIDDLESEYKIKNAQIKLGSNKDWYMIYGRQNGRNNDIRFCGNRWNKCSEEWKIK
jgi:hypothetical protein